MHELSLLADLLRKIEDVAREAEATRVICVRVELGALAHISPSHFREHFEHATRGGVAAQAELEITENSDEADVYAQEIRLTSIDVE